MKKSIFKFIAPILSILIFAGLAGGCGGKKDTVK